MSKEEAGKQSPRRKRTKSANAMDERVEAYLKQAAKEMKGRPLDLSEDSPLRQMMGRLVELTLEEEMSEHLGYAPHERQKTEEGDQAQRRKNTRNGHTSKRLRTSEGEAEIRVPRDREATFEPKIVRKRGTLSQEMERRIVAMYAQGMTTRDIQAHVEEMYYGYEVSEMFVSRVVERLEPELVAWRSRSLEELYAVVFIDALHVKVRHPSGVASTALYQVAGYGESGHMEILGLYMAPEGYRQAESATFWHQVLVELEKRGVKEVLIVCADQLAGLEAAVASVYPRAHYQPCVVHMMRNSMRRVPWSERRKVAADVKRIYQAATYDQAEQELERLHELYGKRHPALVRQWTQALPRLADLWRYSEPLRKLVYTTNPIENNNRQARKVTKNRGAFPNANSALRLLTLVMMRINERSSTRVRPDWTRIVKELEIHFPDRLPENWGFRT